VNGAKPKSRAGFTLAELVVTMSLTGIVSFICLHAIIGSQRLSAHVMADGHLHEQARILVEQMAREIRYSSVTAPEFNLPDGQDCTSVSFRKCIGYDSDNELRRWSDLTGYEIAAIPDSGETNISDGVDNNDNGLVDECGFYRIEDGSRRRLLCRDVEAPRFLVRRDGTTVTIRVGLFRLDPSVRGHVLRGDYETAVVLRN